MSTREVEGYLLTRVPGGTFVMGSPPDEAGRDETEGPQHEVTLAPFFIGVYPVTHAQYQRFLAVSPDVPRPDLGITRAYAPDTRADLRPAVGMANGFGLHDVHGNVWEWCTEDFHQDAYRHPVRPGDGRRELPPAEYRVIRGGSWMMSARVARSAFRSYGSRAPNALVGLRCVLPDP